MNDQELNQLDDFVAEKVMGYRSAISPLQPKGTKEETSWDTRPRCGGRGWYFICKRDWKPTRDTTQAMKVFERCVMYAEPRGVYCVWNAGHNKYEVGLESMDTMGQEAETIPLAICLFAKQLFTKE